jgi:hypothetical protein
MNPQTPKRGRGRPRKFDAPSRAVTVTLPDDVLARLRTIDADLGRAIVTAVDRTGVTPHAPIPTAELTKYGRHAVIVVTPLKALKRLAGVQLVPVSNGKCLISLEHPRSTAELELAIRDAIARDDVDDAECEALESIADILRSARADRDIGLEERTIIVLESRRARRHSS